MLEFLLTEYHVVLVFVFIFYATDLLQFSFYIFTGLLYRNRFSENPDYQPLVSVVVPAWNEAVGIQSAIQSILNNSYKQVEIIVVNDGSTDQTADIVSVLAEQYPDTIKLVNQPNTGKSQAINNGVRNHAQGSIILSFDADSWLHSDAIANLVKHFQSEDVQGVVGNYLFSINSFWTLPLYVSNIVGFHFKRAKSVLGSIYILSGAISAYRKEAFRAVAGFSTESKTEDLDFTLKFIERGFKLKYAHDALCLTEASADFYGLLQQQTRYRYGFFQSIHIYSQIFTNSSIPLFTRLIIVSEVYWRMVILLLRPYLSPLLIIWAILTSHYWIIALLIGLLPLTLLLILPTRHDKSTVLKLVLPSPFLSYLLVCIEHIALVAALYTILRRREIKWQRWNRRGNNISD